MSGVDVLARAVFAANARNSGNNPDEHFVREAGEQWMAQALVDCGVAELIEAATDLRQRQRDYLADPKGERSNDKGRLVGVAAERLDAALARVQGGAP